VEGLVALSTFKIGLIAAPVVGSAIGIVLALKATTGRSDAPVSKPSKAAPAPAPLPAETLAQEAWRMEGRADTLANNGKHEESIPFYERAIQLDPTNPQLLFRASASEFKARRLASTWNHARRAAELAGEEAAVTYYMFAGNVLARCSVQELDCGASPFLSKAGGFEALDAKGAALVNAKKIDDAARIYVRAYGLSGTPLALLRVAQTDALRDNLQSANHHVGEVLKRNPDPAVLKEAREFISLLQAACMKRRVDCDEFELP
jgi:tetratricopeptide (TPR) repeat protein